MTTWTDISLQSTAWADDNLTYESNFAFNEAGVAFNEKGLQFNGTITFDGRGLIYTDTTKSATAWADA